MANDTGITIRGWAGMKPTLYINSQNKNEKTSQVSAATLTVGVTPRSYDRKLGNFRDGETSWYSVRCYGALARNAAISVQKGTPVLVRGKLTSHSYKDKNGAERHNQVIIADSIAIDLNYGIANYMKAQAKIGELDGGSFSPHSQLAEVTSEAEVTAGENLAEKEASSSVFRESLQAV